MAKTSNPTLPPVVAICGPKEDESKVVKPEPPPPPPPTDKPLPKSMVKMDRNAAHTVYKLKDGKRVPGATTILQVLNKPFLLDWAWQCGMDGIGHRKVKDNAGTVGTLAHWLCECYLTGETPDTSVFSPADLKVAQRSFEMFEEWWKRAQLAPLTLTNFKGEKGSNEVALVSERYRFGGTLDLPCIDAEGHHVLVDFKTSKAIYDDYWLQLAGYNQLKAETTEQPFDRFIIVRIGKEGGDDFEVQERPSVENEWRVFNRCVEIHYLRLKDRGLFPREIELPLMCKNLTTKLHAYVPPEHLQELLDDVYDLEKAIRST